MFLTDLESNRLNPPILDAVFDEETGKEYEERLTDPYWLNMGYRPRPTTWLGWFVYHLVHGLWMKYPWYKVLLFSIVQSGERYHNA